MKLREIDSRMNPPISYGTMKKEREHLIKKILSENEFLKFTSITNKKIQDKFLKIKLNGDSPKETKHNRTSVGSKNKISNIYSLYNPHNYRLYFDFEKIDFHPLRPSEPTYEKAGGRLNLRNSKEWETQEQILGCNLIVKKNQVQINNLIDPKRWHLILMGDIDKRIQQIREIHEKKINEALQALESFLKVYGGKSKFKLLRIWCEEKIEHDKPIDKLPIDMFFTSKNVKKAYGEKVIEYFGDPIQASNYFSNRGIEDIAPRIAESLNNLSMRFDNMGHKIIDMMKYRGKVDTELLIHVQTHNRVFRKLDRLLSTKLEGPPKKKIKDKPLGKWLG